MSGRLMTVGKLASYFSFHIDVVSKWTHEPTFSRARVTKRGRMWAVDEVLVWLSIRGGE